jgi:O-antigen/teichoic acid export membrane protein
MIKVKALREVSLLWVGALLGAFAAFLLQILLARELGPHDFGVFSSAFTTIQLILPLAGFGVAQFWLKVYGQEGGDAQRWLSASFRFVLFSTSLVLLLVFGWAYFGPNDSITTTILYLFSILIVAQVMIELVSARFQLEERFVVLALWQFMPHLLRLVFLLMLAFYGTYGFGLMGVANIYALTSGVFVVFGLFYLGGMKKGRFNLKGHIVGSSGKLSLGRKLPSALDVVADSWPFGMAAFFHLIYYQSDIIFLKYISGNESAGIYNVAFTVMAAIYLLPGVIYQKYLLPKMHRWAIHDKDKFYQVYMFGNKAMLLIGLIAMLGIWVTAFWLLPLLFGEAYENSILILNILALSAPVIFLAFNSGAALVTKENMRKKVWYMGCVAVLNIVLNIILIPPYSGEGAAAATVLSNLILLLAYYYGTKKYVFSKT